MRRRTWKRKIGARQKLAFVRWLRKGASLFSSKRVQAQNDAAATPAVTGRDPVADLPPDLVSSWRLLAPALPHNLPGRRQAVTRLIAIERIVDTKAAILLKRAGIPITAQLRLYELLAHYRLTNLHRWPGFDRVAPNALLEAATARVPPSASQKR